MSHRSAGPQEKRRSHATTLPFPSLHCLPRDDWTYEEAKEFFKQTSDDGEWSWEKDTTLRDIQDNPLAFLALLGLILLTPLLPPLSPIP
jgi:hypothetical protein